MKLMETEVKYTNQLNEAGYASQRLANDNQSLKKQLNDYQTSITVYEGEANKRFAAYEQNNYTLGR